MAVAVRVIIGESATSQQNRCARMARADLVMLCGVRNRPWRDEWPGGVGRDRGPVGTQRWMRVGARVSKNADTPSF